MEYGEEEIRGNHLFFICSSLLILTTVAIQRKYESLRRHWKLEEEKDAYDEYLKLSSRRKKYRQRRQRVYLNPHCVYLVSLRLFHINLRVVLSVS